MQGGFDAGIGCLREKIKRVRHIDRAVSQVLRDWIENAERGYRTAVEVGMWVDLVMEDNPELLPMVAFVIARGVRPFWMVFVHFARLWRKGRADTREAVRSAALALDRECHKMAIALLDQGVDCAEIWQLACFEEDCPEAEELASVLSPNSG
jgi:hypothetical protein